MSHERPIGIGNLTAERVRLEDLDDDDANNPRGRGRETAAGRGYDVERVMLEVLDVDDSNCDWCDGFHDDWLIPIESKSCIDRYPSGQHGRFRILYSNHLAITMDRHGWYFFLIYTVDESGLAKEIGKLVVDAVDIDELIGDSWNTRYDDRNHFSMYKDLTWTTVLEALGVDRDLLRESEYVWA